MSHLKASIHILENICLSLDNVSSLILQLGGLLSLIGGIAVAAAVGAPDEKSKIGKFEFWYQ
jgi:hypothetical protein